MKKFISVLFLIFCFNCNVCAASNNIKSIAADEVSQNGEFSVGIYASGENKVYSYSCEVLYNENDTEFEGIDAGLFVYDLKKCSGDISFYYRKGRLVGYTKVTKGENRALILITSVGKSDFLDKIIEIKFNAKCAGLSDVLLKNESAVSVSDEGAVLLNTSELTYTYSKNGECAGKCSMSPFVLMNTAIDIKGK